MKKPKKKAVRSKTKRFDVRLTAAHRAKLVATAKKTNHTITDIVAELIENMR